VEERKVEKKKRVETVTLLTTAKARLARKWVKLGFDDSSMDVEPDVVAEVVEEEEPKPKPKKKVREPRSFVLPIPRALPNHKRMFASLIRSSGIDRFVRTMRYRELYC
jgi:hypothetical protein